MDYTCKARTNDNPWLKSQENWFRTVVSKRKERTKNKTLTKITLLKQRPFKATMETLSKICSFGFTVTWPERAKKESEDRGNSYREMRAVKWTEAGQRGRVLANREGEEAMEGLWGEWVRDNAWWLHKYSSLFSLDSTTKQNHTSDLCKRERHCENNTLIFKYY